MMWRLNFLVVLVCIALQNNYMLYYICPMHTLFTIMVYAVLGLGSKFNSTHLGIIAKYEPSSPSPISMKRSFDCLRFQTR